LQFFDGFIGLVQPEVTQGEIEVRLEARKK